MIEWIRATDRLPEAGEYVILLAEDRFWSVPDGVPEMQVTATGYLAQISEQKYWSIHGERGMELNAFTHWAHIPTLLVDG